MTTAKVFKDGDGQAVLLPREFRVEGDEVEISRVGQAIVLRPKRISYEDALAAASRFRGTLRRSQGDSWDR
jgi:antitoxin VapB